MSANLPAFTMACHADGAWSVDMDGQRLRGVVGVTVSLPLNGVPRVSLEFIAASVNEPAPRKRFKVASLGDLREFADSVRTGCRHVVNLAQPPFGHCILCDEKVIGSGVIAVGDDATAPTEGA